MKRSTDGPELNTPQSIVYRAVSWLGLAIAVVVTIWAIAALYFDLRLPGAGRVTGTLLFVVLLAAGLWKLPGKRMLYWAVCILAVLVWWFSLAPSDDQPWQPDVARLPSAEVRGDNVTILNVRDCKYVTETDYQPRWETKILDLDKIQGVDLFLTHWGSPFIAHAIVSFHFAGDTYVAMSIEARKIVGQEYSAVKGFFRQYGLIYLVAEERDVILLRTNYRKGELVSLYHTLTTPQDARRLFLQYISWINSLNSKPQWYNALTDNCTSSITSYLVRAKVGGLSAWDWRTVLNGKGDKMLYELGDLATAGLTFPQLKEQALINPAAQAIGDAADFSHRIRAGRAGFTE